MRACHVIHDLRRGGAEHLLSDLAVVAGGAGMEMSVVSLMPLSESGYADSLRASGIPLRSLGLRSRWDPRAAARLRRVVEDLRPDVLHSHLKHADLVVGRVALRVDIPMVSSLHVVEDAVGVLGRFKRDLAMRARDRAADRILAVSAALRQWYLGLSGRDPATVLVLHNGVPAPGPVVAGHRERVRAALGVPQDAVLAATMVILRPGKGVEDLLAAASALPAEPDVRFVVAGSGPEEGAMRATASRLGLLGTRVVFPGFVDDVAGLLAAVDLLVHPSHGDALPTAVIHAMAAGLPVVATRVGGIAEIVGEDHGILVPPGDPVALGAAVSTLAGDPGRRQRMGGGARERFAASFEIGSWARRLIEIYGEVIAERGRQRRP